jgi:YD repeat-containing protein
MTVEYNSYGDEYQITARYNKAQRSGRGWSLPTVIDSTMDRINQVMYTSGGVEYARIDGEGRVVSTEMDDFNRPLRSIEHYDNATFSGGAWIMPFSSTLDRVTQRVYDAFGRVSADVDASGIVTSYQFDAYDRVTVTRVHVEHAIKVNGGWDLSGVDNNDEDRVVEQKYDAATGRVYASINAAGVIVSYEHDAFDQQTKAVYHYQRATFNGEGWDLPDPLAHAEDHSSQSVRDAAGRVVYSIDAAGFVTMVSYDAFNVASGQMSYAVPLAAGTARTLQGIEDYFETHADPLHDRYTAVLHRADGKASYSIDALGYLTAYEYNEHGEVTGVLRYADAIENWSSTLELPSDPRTLVTPDSDADQFTAMAYDAAGRQRFQVSALGGVKEMRYNQFGELSMTIEYQKPIDEDAPQPWGQSFPHTLADLEAWAGQNTVAAQDRRSAVVYFDNGKVAYQIDAFGAVTGYRLNAYGDVAKTIRYWKTVDWSTMSAAPAPGWTHEADSTTENGVAVTRDRSTVAIIGADGREKFVVDADNYVAERTYDAYGNVASEIRYQRPLGITVFEWSTTVATIEGQRHNLTHLEDGTEVPAPVTLFKYDELGRMVERSVQITADRVDPATGQTIAGQRTRTRTSYDVFGQVVEVTQAYETSDASTVRRSYDKLGRVVTEWQGYGSDAESRTEYIHRIDGVDVIDPRGYLLAETNDSWAKAQRKAKLGAAKEMAENLTEADKAQLRAMYTTSQTTDRNGRVVRMRLASGAVTATTYDAFGRQIEVAVAKRAEDIGTALASVTSTEYDDHARTSTTVEESDRRTINTMNAFGELVRSEVRANHAYTGASDQLTIITRDKLGRESAVQTSFGSASSADRNSTEAFNAFGETKEKTVSWSDGGGAHIGTWSYKYDKRGQLVEETLPTTSSYNQAVKNKYSYDANGNRIKSIEADGLTEQRVTEFAYDMAGRMVVKKGESVSLYQNGTATTGAPYDVFIYDLRGNRIRTISAASDASGTGGASEYSFYDKQNRQTATLNAGGMLTEWKRDSAGNPVEVVVYGQAVTLTNGSLPVARPGPGNYRKTLFTYDAANHMTEARIDDVLLGEYREDLAGGAGYLAYRGAIVTSHEYDELGNLIKSVDARGGVSRSYYDKSNRKVAQLDAGGHLTTWDYRTAANTGLYIVESQYGGAAISAADSDTVDQLRARAYQAAFGRAPTPAEVADYYAPPASANGSQVHISCSYYNAVGDLTEQRVWMDGNAYGPSAARHEAITSYVLNGLGQIASMTDADGMETHFRYDALGRQVRQETKLNKIVSHLGTANTTAGMVDGTEKVSETTYNGLGAVYQQIDRGNTTAEHRISSSSYDKLGRLVSQTDGNGNVTTFDYDRAGNQTRVTRVVPDENGIEVSQYQWKTYDSLGRVVSSYAGPSVDANTVETAYVYNIYGELEQKGTRRYGTSTALQEYFVYDQVGKLQMSNTGDGVTRIHLYDAFGNETLTIRSAGAVDLRYKSLQDLDIDSASGKKSGHWLHQAVMTMNTFDANNRQLKTIEPDSEVVDVVQQIAARAKSFVDDGLGAIMSIVNGGQSAPSKDEVSKSGKIVGTGGIRAPIQFTVETKRGWLHSPISGPNGEAWHRVTNTSTVDSQMTFSMAGQVDDSGIGRDYEIEVRDELGYIVALGAGSDTITLSIDRHIGNPLISTKGSITVFERLYAGDGSAGRRIVAHSQYVTGGPEPEYIDYSPSEAAGATTYTMTNSIGSVTQQPRAQQLVLSGLPGAATRVLLAYRPKGSVDAYQFTPFDYVRDSQGNRPRSDVFVLTIDAQKFGDTEYEFQTMAMDDQRNLVATNGGTFQRVGDAVVVRDWPGDSPRLQAGLGAMVAYDQITQETFIRFIDQTPGADGLLRSGRTMTVRYRADDGSWQDGNLTGDYIWREEYWPNTLWYLEGSARWKLPAGLSGTRDYVVELKESDGTVVNRMAGQLVAGNPPRLISAMPLDYVEGVVRIGNVPPGTGSVTVRYGAGQSALAVASTSEPGVFLWDARGLSAGTYSYEVDTTTDGVVTSTTAGEVRLGANAAQLSRSVVAGSAGGAKPANFGSACWVLNGLHALTNSTTVEYDAFGNAAKRTDARGNSILIEYDAAGRAIKQTGQADAYLESDGSVAYRTKPVERYVYSDGGRLVRRIDARDKSMYYTYINMTDASGNHLSVVEQSHTGKLYNRKQYNLFGEVHIATDANDDRTVYEYDKNGNLTHVLKDAEDGQFTDAVEDWYQYDARNLRTSATHEIYGTNGESITGTSRTYYDADGRIRRTKSAAGVITDYEYQYNDTADNATGGVDNAYAGGYTVGTRIAEAGSLESSKRVGYFGRELGGTYTGTYSKFTYDFAGLVVEEVHGKNGGDASSRSYGYYASGKVKRVVDYGTSTAADYAYDASGNKLYERQSSINASGANDRVLDVTTMVYDGMNRVTEVLAGEASLRRYYDAAGNIERTISKDGDVWNDFDELNRMTVSGGLKVLNAIVRGDRGTSIEYDAVGNRSRVVYGKFAAANAGAYYGMVQTETYSHRFSDGELISVSVTRDQESAPQDTSTRSATVEDGKLVWTQTERVDQLQSSGWVNVVKKEVKTVYDKDGQVMGESTKNVRDGRGRVDNYKSINYFYRADGTTLDYQEELTIDSAPSTTDPLSELRTVTTSRRTTQLYDAVSYSRGVRQAVASETEGTTEVHLGEGSSRRRSERHAVSGEVKNTFNAKGVLTKSTNTSWSERDLETGAYDAPVGSHTTVTYQTDINDAVVAQHQITRRVSGDGTSKVEHRFTANVVADGKVIGAISNDSLQDNYDIRTNTESPPEWTPQQVSDFQQNYVSLSESTRAGATGRYTVLPGDTLQSIAQRVFGDAKEWYRLADANGLMGAVGLVSGQVLAIPNRPMGASSGTSATTRANVARSNSGLLDLANTRPDDKSCRWQQLMVSAISIAVSGGFKLLPGVGQVPILGDVLGQAAGNIAGQIAANFFGLQQGFDYGAIAKAAVGGAVSGFAGFLGGQATQAVTFSGAMRSGVKAVASGAVSIAGNALGGTLGGFVGGAGTRVLNDLATGKGINWGRVAGEGMIGAAIGGLTSFATQGGDALRQLLPDASKGFVPAVLQQVTRFARAIVVDRIERDSKDALYKLIYNERSEKETSARMIWGTIAVDAFGAALSEVRAILKENEAEKEAHRRRVEGYAAAALKTINEQEAEAKRAQDPPGSKRSKLDLPARTEEQTREAILELADEAKKVQDKKDAYVREELRVRRAADKNVDNKARNLIKLGVIPDAWRANLGDPAFRNMVRSLSGSEDVAKIAAREGYRANKWSELSGSVHTPGSKAETDGMEDYVRASWAADQAELERQDLEARIQMFNDDLEYANYLRAFETTNGLGVGTEDRLVNGEPKVVGSIIDDSRELADLMGLEDKYRPKLARNGVDRFDRSNRVDDIGELIRFHSTINPQASRGEQVYRSFGRVTNSVANVMTAMTSSSFDDVLAVNERRARIANTAFYALPDNSTWGQQVMAEVMDGAFYAAFGAAMGLAGGVGAALGAAATAAYGVASTEMEWTAAGVRSEYTHAAAGALALLSAVPVVGRGLGKVATRAFMKAGTGLVAQAGKTAIGRAAVGLASQGRTWLASSAGGTAATAVGRWATQDAAGKAITGVVTEVGDSVLSGFAESMVLSDGIGYVMRNDSSVSAAEYQQFLAVNDAQSAEVTGSLIGDFLGAAIANGRAALRPSAVHVAGKQPVAVPGGRSMQPANERRNVVGRLETTEVIGGARVADDGHGPQPNAGFAPGDQQSAPIIGAAQNLPEPARPLDSPEKTPIVGNPGTMVAEPISEVGTPAKVNPFPDAREGSWVSIDPITGERHIDFPPSYLAKVRLTAVLEANPLREADYYREHADGVREFVNELIYRDRRAMGLPIVPGLLEDTYAARRLAQFEKEKNLQYSAGDSSRSEKTSVDDAAVKATLNGGGCFVAGTYVHAFDGLKPIEDIRVGDRVHAYNFVSESIEVRTVRDIFAHKNKPVIEIVVSVNGSNMSLEGTFGHPFWVENQGWTPMAELERDDKVRLIDGRLVDVIDKCELDATQDVFNFHVDGLHNYFVGEEGVLVHNTSLSGAHELPPLLPPPFRAEREPIVPHALAEADLGAPQMAQFGGTPMSERHRPILREPYKNGLIAAVFNNESAAVRRGERLDRLAGVVGKDNVRTHYGVMPLRKHGGNGMPDSPDNRTGEWVQLLGEANGVRSTSPEAFAGALNANSARDLRKVLNALEEQGARLDSVQAILDPNGRVLLDRPVGLEVGSKDYQNGGAGVERMRTWLAIAESNARAAERQGSDPMHAARILPTLEASVAATSIGVAAATKPSVVSPLQTRQKLSRFERFERLSNGENIPMFDNMSFKAGGDRSYYVKPHGQRRMTHIEFSRARAMRSGALREAELRSNPELVAQQDFDRAARPLNGAGAIVSSSGTSDNSAWSQGTVGSQGLTLVNKHGAYIPSGNRELDQPWARSPHFKNDVKYWTERGVRFVNDPEFLKYIDASGAVAVAQGRVMAFFDANTPNAVMRGHEFAHIQDRLLAASTAPIMTDSQLVQADMAWDGMTEANAHHRSYVFGIEADERARITGQPRVDPSWLARQRSMRDEHLSAVRKIPGFESYSARDPHLNIDFVKPSRGDLRDLRDNLMLTSRMSDDVLNNVNRASDVSNVGGGNAASAGGRNVTMYRVDTNGFPRRILPDGTVPVISDNAKGWERALFVNFGQPERAREFALKLRKGQATVTAVEVDASLLDKLRAISVTEKESKGSNGAPLRVDVDKAPDQYSLRRKSHIQWLREAIVPGSARVIDPRDL